MPKLSNFRKMLRLAEKADKHRFRNAPQNHRTEDYRWYCYESIGIMIDRTHKTGMKTHKSKFPK